ncbi:MAG: antiviral reverse transcriptase Drt2 [Pseudomonadales bacterium]
MAKQLYSQTIMTIDSWYKQRTYLHFDLPLSKKKARSLVTNKSKVAQHSFLPFLAYTTRSQKITKDKHGRVIQKPAKERPIAFASHADSHIYAYYCELLTPLYERKINEYALNDTVLAFRKLGKNNIDFAAEAFDTIRNTGSCTAIAYDISGFFDNLDHRILKESWCSLHNVKRLAEDEFAVFKSITRFATVERDRAYEVMGISKNNPKSGRYRISDPIEFREKIRKQSLIQTNTQGKGIPQGSPISAFLSNIYMLKFDKYINEEVLKFGGTYYRYCDDMLFVVPKSARNKITDLVRREIKRLKLDINKDKIEIRDFNTRSGKLRAQKPLQYLGFLFDGQHTYLRSASLARYSERMRRGVNLAKKTQRKHNKQRSIMGLKERAVFRKKLYSRYSHFGARNFVTYGLRAAERMSSPQIRKQLKPLWHRLLKEIDS